MKHSRPHRARRMPSARIGGAALALAALSASALAAAPASAATSVVVSTNKSPKGTVLESGGATLYILEGNKACNAACQKFWPELVLAKGESKAKAGKGVKHTRLGSVKRAHGVRQITYEGKPLYKFVGDHGGSVNGDITDAWGTWAAVVTSKASTTASHTNATTSTTGGTSGTSGTGGVSF